jgi:hypothetical protein
MIGPDDVWIGHAIIVEGLHRMHEVCKGTISRPRTRD